MMTLRLASFGVRGYVGESLTPRVVMDFASAFAAFVDGGRVVLGRDTRTSSPMLHAAVLSSLLSAGCEVLDLGICPTPMLQFSVPLLGASGGVSISGGHNGMGWNALTLIGADGAILEPMGGESVLDRYHALNFLKQDAQHMGTVRPVGDVAGPYFAALQRHVDVEAIRAAGLTVLIDPVGGAACPYLDAFAQRLGFRLVGINAQPSGYLAREPEPRPRSATQMASIIKHLGGHVGFVLSSDMGRLSIVTEDGEPASEEFTFALIVDHVLQRSRGTVVTNCCTTRAIDDLAAKHGSTVVKTPVGQAYVVSRLADEGGRIGGEGSGSVVLPEFSHAFDGFLMMSLILESMASEAAPISALLRRLPHYHITKRRVPCESRRTYHALDHLSEHVAELGEARVDFTDGLRLDWEDGWLHVRASHTEQLIRVICEARDRAVAVQRAEQAIRLLDEAL